MGQFIKKGSRKLHICPKVTKMGSIIGQRIDYNGVGALRGQQHIPSKNLPQYHPLPPWGAIHLLDNWGLKEEIQKYAYAITLQGTSKAV